MDFLFFKGKELESFFWKKNIGDRLEIWMVKSTPLMTQFRYSVAVVSMHAHFVPSLRSDSGPTDASKKLLQAGRGRVHFIKFPLLTLMQDLWPWKNFLATQLFREDRVFLPLHQDPGWLSFRDGKGVTFLCIWIK